MLLVECKGCGAVAATNDHANPDRVINCGCCPIDHDHAAAANACPGGHDGQPCPHDAGACPMWKGVQAAVASAGHTPEKVAQTLGVPVEVLQGDCPGGHCAKGVDGCTVCRPLTITLLAPADGETPTVEMQGGR
jgi:hypothetical protein